MGENDHTVLVDPQLSPTCHSRIDIVNRLLRELVVDLRPNVQQCNRRAERIYRWRYKCATALGTIEAWEFIKRLNIRNRAVGPQHYSLQRPFTTTLIVTIILESRVAHSHRLANHAYSEMILKNQLFKHQF